MIGNITHIIVYSVKYINITVILDNNFAQVRKKHFIRILINLGIVFSYFVLIKYTYILIFNTIKYRYLH